MEDTLDPKWDPTSAEGPKFTKGHWTNVPYGPQTGKIATSRSLSEIKAMYEKQKMFAYDRAKYEKDEKSLVVLDKAGDFNGEVHVRITKENAPDGESKKIPPLPEPQTTVSTLEEIDIMKARMKELKAIGFHKLDEEQKKEYSQLKEIFEI